MKRTPKIIFSVVASILLVTTIGLLNVTKKEAHKLITAPMETRELSEEVPVDYNLPYEDVTVMSDGWKLVGWFVPSQNGAVITMPRSTISENIQTLID
jgi:hypothetical protein